MCLVCTISPTHRALALSPQPFTSHHFTAYINFSLKASTPPPFPYIALHYVNRGYDACIAKHPDTAMIINDIPCAINTPSHQTPFLANTKLGFQVLILLFQRGHFSKLRLWKLRLPIELPLLWRQQLPVAIVIFLPF